MLNQMIQPDQMWLTREEPHLQSYVPNSYIILLTALENGWQIGKVELLPSWDQHGLIYLVTLHLHTPDHSQQIILPRNPLVDQVLAEQPLRKSLPVAA